MKTLDRVVLYGGLGLLIILAVVGFQKPQKNLAELPKISRLSYPNVPPSSDITQTVYIVSDNQYCYTFPPAVVDGGTAYPDFYTFSNPVIPDRIIWKAVNGHSYTVTFATTPIQGVAMNTPIPVTGGTSALYQFNQIGATGYNPGDNPYTVVDQATGQSCSAPGTTVGIHITH